MSNQQDQFGFNFPKRSSASRSLRTHFPLTSNIGGKKQTVHHSSGMVNLFSALVLCLVLAGFIYLGCHAVSWCLQNSSLAIPLSAMYVLSIAGSLGPLFLNGNIRDFSLVFFLSTLVFMTIFIFLFIIETQGQMWPWKGYPTLRSPSIYDSSFWDK